MYGFAQYFFSPASVSKKNVELFARLTGINYGIFT